MANSNTTVTIPKEFTVGGQEVDLNFTSPDLALIGIVDNGGQFPPGDLTLGSLSANVASGNPVTLGTQTKNIAFSFSAGTTYGLQILSDPDDVLAALNADANIEGDIDLKTGTAATDRFMLLRLTYNLGGTAKGTAALGVGLTANFGATGALSGDWDVVHRFGSESAVQVLKDTFSSWRLPLAFSQPSDLKPGTWLVSEVNGSVNLNLGVQAGYNYSWIKQLADGNLTGDIGVKVTLSATASLGFSVNGTYALVLARPDGTNTLRLSLYKLAKNDFQFALNASAGVQGVLPPALRNVSNISGLVQAIFGTQVTQLVNDLQTVQKVAAGGALTDQAADYLVALGEKKLGAVADRVTAFNKAVDIIKDAENFLSQLSTLGPKLTSQLLSMLPSTANGGAGAIADLTTVLTDIQSVAADPAQITTIISEQLQKVAFFQTNFGMWLTSALQDAGQASPLTALKDNAAVQAIGKAATQTLNLINGTDLQTLIDYAAAKLDLKDIPTLAEVDSWLKSKIAAFLNKAVGSVVQQDLATAQAVVTNLLNKGDAFVAEVIKAVKKQYELTFVATYESTTSDTALIDVSFDFDANPALGPLLHNAINGDFTRILIDPSIAGVTLNSAVLTHGFHRQTHVEITLPFLDAGKTAATDVVDRMTTKHDGVGRILAYTVTGSNAVTSFVQGRSVRDSIMTLAMNLDKLAGVNKAPQFTASFGYSLRAAYAKTSVQQVVAALTPLVSAYNLPLGAGDVLPWTIDLDKITEQVPTGQIGTSLMALDVAIDSSLPGVWMKAPVDPKHPAYLALSRSIQERLRALIGSVYFSQPNAYSTILTARKMIIYTSLRTANGFNTDSSNDPPRVGTPTNDVYWDAVDPEQLTALIFDPATLQAATSMMNETFQLLTSRGNKSDAAFFQNNGVNRNALVTDALHKSSTQSTMPDVLGSLVLFESQFITQVISAATGLAQFVSNAGANPSTALKQLSDFTSKIVSAFNQGLGDNLVGGDELATLGSALFTEVTIALAQTINATLPENASPSALFSLSIPLPGANISLNDLKAGNFKPEQILVEQKLSSPLAALAQTAVTVG